MKEINWEKNRQKKQETFDLLSDPQYTSLIERYVDRTHKIEELQSELANKHGIYAEYLHLRYFISSQREKREHEAHKKYTAEVRKVSTEQVQPILDRFVKASWEDYMAGREPQNEKLEILEEILQANGVAVKRSILRRFLDERFYKLRKAREDEEKRLESELFRTQLIRGSGEFSDILAMDGLEFEKYLEKLFRQLGYSVKLTPQSGDQGADLIATKGNDTVAIQAKRMQASVGNWAVQAAHSARGFYGTKRAMVITNSTFTRQAKELAERLDVELVDGERMKGLLKNEVSE